MAKRRNNASGQPRGKSESEARIERITWFFLVLIFAILQIFSQNSSAIPNWFVPFSGAMVLLASGLYQYRRGWRVSPITWIAGSLLLFLGLFNLYANPNRSFLGESLVIFAGVILLGLLTGET